MRRPFLISAAFTLAFLLVLFVRGAASVVRSPVLTYGGLTGALFSYDVGIDTSVPLVRGVDKLPVAWSWSPDGSLLAYVLLDFDSGQYEILLWTPHTGQTTTVARRLPFGSPPQWSPDGRTIAAVDINQDICLYAVGGGEPHCLNVQPAGQPTWSPDGTAIAYLSRLPEGGLLRVDIAGGRVTPLFPGVNGINHPRWSPEGSLIVFTYQVDQGGCSHIYSISSGGGEISALTNDESSQEQPVWSPDGRLLAYSERQNCGSGSPEVSVMIVESGEIIHVTDHEGIDIDPRWSPDGRYLAFVTNRFDDRPRLQVIPVRKLDSVEPLISRGVLMRLYAFAWRP